MAGSSVGGGDGGRKKRRQLRPVRSNGREAAPAAHNDVANREHVFQDIEGRMRRIRELAEEGAAYSSDEIRQLAQNVVSLFRTLEGEGEVVSDRAFAEYQRLRDRLNQALRSAPASKPGP